MAKKQKEGDTKMRGGGGPREAERKARQVTVSGKVLR